MSMTPHGIETGSLPSDLSGNGSERKPVTVLFSDLSGYSTLCERLDPEEVREMMRLVFQGIIGIISRYEGHIDRIIGDEVLAVFGIPRVHEDDPVRAILSALEIHQAVARMSEQFKTQLERPLAMHSGIATGMVVTGKSDPTPDKHSITGDAVNRASLLTNLATAGEILVGSCTMASTSGFFLFEKCVYRTGKTINDTIDTYRLLDIEKKPNKVRRVQGLRSRLIGRETEMKVLREALADVFQGRGACVFIKGDAGTGKSRLIAELRRSVALRDVQWFQGNAYTYTQNVPYFPLTDLLGRAADVREDDSEAVVMQKLARKLNPLVGKDGPIIQILGRLFMLSGDNAIKITPEAWKINLRRTLIQLITGQSRTGVTVVCLEDLHWADPSTVEMFRMILDEIDLPIFFLVSCRPDQPSATNCQVTNPYYRGKTILIEDLPPEKSEALVKSLLKTEAVPQRLLTFIAEHLGGNPFFLEEMINSLIDTGILRKNGAVWQINGAINATAFSSNISTVIAARLDRLGDTVKRLVQEASVIGRHFSPTVLKQIASDPKQVDHHLAILESLGLILQSDDPGENLFMFKHALVQEVAYNSLLKRQRKKIHEKIARVLESQNPDRIDVLYETLAFHFSNGYSLHRAVYYLIRSARKGMKKFAVVESHNYYEKAYQILTGREPAADDSSSSTVKLLLEWFFIFNMRGRYEDALTLMKRHESAAMNSADPQLKGMYLTCLGWAHQRREDLNTSRNCLLEALSIGERTNNYKVIAYSCACLIWTCTDLGRLDEAMMFATKAETASRFIESEDPLWSFEMDQDLVRFVLTGTAIACWFRGDCRQCRKLGDRLLAYGEKASDVNSISEGHLAHGMECLAAGDYRGAIKKCTVAVDRSVNPLYTFNARFLMAYAHLSLGEVLQAEKNLREIAAFCQASGYAYIGSAATALYGVVTIAKGNLGAGVKALDTHIKQFMDDRKHYHAQILHYILGCIYLQIAVRKGKPFLGMVVRNPLFCLTHLPRSAKLAEYHFNTAIRIAGQINALGIKGQALLDLGRLYQAKRRNDLAMPLIRESVTLFEQLGAKWHLKRALDVLAVLA